MTANHHTPHHNHLIPDPLKEAVWAWLRPVLAFLALTAVIGVVLLAGVTAVLNLGTVMGIGVTMLLAAAGVGTGVWWIDRKGLL